MESRQSLNFREFYFFMASLRESKRFGREKSRKDNAILNHQTQIEKFMNKQCGLGRAGVLHNIKGIVSYNEVIEVCVLMRCCACAL